MIRVRSFRRGPTPALAVTSTVLGVLVLAACSPPAGSSAAGPSAAPPSAAAAPGARSVIFVNGDGMAAAQREAGRLSIAGLDGDLEMDDCRPRVS